MTILDPEAPVLLSGGRSWTPRTPVLFPTHKGRLLESIADLLKHPSRSRGLRGRLSRARLDEALERARGPIHSEPNNHG